MKSWVVICCSALLAVVCTDECPDGGKCDDGQTCCKHPSNIYECCPFDQAECCGDHVHCCPAGTTCNMSKSSCMNSTVSIPWTERSPVQQPRVSKSFRMIKSYIGEDDDNICPDQSRCPAEFTCLRVLTKYGCCPLAQGIPCSDGKHCCPEGHSCSEDSRSCIKKDNVAKPGEHASNVSCDPINACPDGTTCCSDGEGSWTCCPFPNAVCCSDHRHCCPSGTTCDLCQETSASSPMSQKTPAVTSTVPASTTESQVIEPAQTEESEEDDEQDYDDDEEEDDQDKVHCNRHNHCPRNSTCCRFGHRRWGCCPMPHAVCCSNGKHCCPQHFNCSKSHQGCVRDDEVIPWYTKLPVKSSPEPQVSIDVAKPGKHASNVSCDPNNACPDGTTCCLDDEESWACCPFPNALCCSDQRHCCPSGTTCDLCQEASGSTPMSQKTPAVLWLNIVSPATTTQTEESEEDDEQDYDDDDEEEEDDQDKVHCNHLKHCPRNSTCCRFGHRRWGCCPMPHAVCCSDGKHCCPQHFNCSKSHQGCVRDDVVIPWYMKLPVVSSIEVDSEIDYVRCRDGKQCPPYNTCCLLSSGEYDCCPMENGVCCSGSNYCCPQGQSCTPGGGCTPNSWLPRDNWPFFRREQKKLQIL